MHSHIVVATHHGAELVVVNLPVVVLVNIVQDLLDVLQRQVLHLLQGHLQLVLSDEAAVVLVKVLKGRLQVLLLVQLAQVDGGSQKLLVVNGAIAVNVGAGDEFAQLGLDHRLLLLPQRRAELLNRDCTAAVDIDSLEQLAQSGHLLNGHVLGNHLESLFLQLVQVGEFLDADCHRAVHGRVGGNTVLLHPLMLQDLVRSCAPAGVLNKHLLDTILCMLRNFRPGVRGEVQPALQDRVKDLLLRVAPEGGHATEEDVQDDSAAPDVGLLAVMPPQNLGSHIISAADNVPVDLVSFEKH
mmetsp:Transcript_38605/g.109175  ORF Transcript_38605/g.109175 Transcript_38605/m.109175 type:complete len:298 (-) Transcript_38605:885-1778(-)